VIGGALAAVVVLVAAVAATWTLKDPGTPMNATQTITRTVTSAPRTPVGAPSQDTLTPALRRLLMAVPVGYVSCDPVRPPAAGALATVECGQNSKPGGPASAFYSLYQTVDALDDAFAQSTDEDTVQDCPGGNTSPGTWDYDSTPEQVEGSVACGTFGDGPEIIWTKSSDLLLAITQGENLETLHQWWVDYV
jgi:serine/threonine kinase PknH